MDETVFDRGPDAAVRLNPKHRATTMNDQQKHEFDQRFHSLVELIQTAECSSASKDWEVTEAILEEAGGYLRDCKWILRQLS